MRISRLVAPVIAVALGAAALAGPFGATAAAAVCGSGDGVSVVVDGRGLGGSLSSVCDADGGGKAGSEIVPSVGYPIDYVQRQPGFVCRVSGAPASDPCVNTPPADAYWGLFWSDGEAGTWSYAGTGITALRVPAGGSIGLAWQDGSERTAPGTDPPVAGPSSTEESAEGEPVAAPIDGAAGPGEGQDDAGGLPLVVPLGLLGLLAALAVAAGVRRRATGRIRG